MRDRAPWPSRHTPLCHRARPRSVRSMRALAGHRCCAAAQARGFFAPLAHPVHALPQLGALARLAAQGFARDPSFALHSCDGACSCSLRSCHRCPKVAGWRPARHRVRNPSAGALSISGVQRTRPSLRSQGSRLGTRCSWPRGRRCQPSESASPPNDGFPASMQAGRLGSSATSGAVLESCSGPGHALRSPSMPRAGRWACVKRSPRARGRVQHSRKSA